METLRRGQRISPYCLEFLATLERTEAYAHTGNTKVLSNAVMKPLFITRGLLEHGMPTIKKAIYTMHFQDISPFTIQESIWPLNRTKNGPAICSKRMHILTYGETNFMVSSYNINTWIFYRGSYRYDPRGYTIHVSVISYRGSYHYDPRGDIHFSVISYRGLYHYDPRVHIHVSLISYRAS